MDKLKNFNNFINENSESILDKDKYNKLMSFLDEHGFDFYGGIEDFDDKWNNTIGSNELSIEEKSVIITGYLDEKWGLYDGYDEVYGFLIEFLK